MKPLEKLKPVRPIENTFRNFCAPLNAGSFSGFRICFGDGIMELWKGGILIFKDEIE
jgi:hypothetical protein